MEARLRTVLWTVTAALFVGVPAELALSEHWGSGPQLVPFALSALSLIAIAAGWARPQRGTLWAVRGAMGLCALGGLFGVWEHLEHNYGFAAEIAPTATASSLIPAALMGANPLLAPAIFLVASALGLAATWGHPALSSGA